MPPRKKTAKRTTKKTAKKRTKKTTKKADGKKTFDLKNVSAKELYRLAKKKEEEESEKETAAQKQKVQELRSQRRELMKQVNGIDRKLAKLGGHKSARKAKSDDDVNLRGMTKKIHEAIKKSDTPLSPDDILKALKLGVNKRASVYATLHSLKRRGLVYSPARGRYAA